jgi:hypothetical protein
MRSLSLLAFLIVTTGTIAPAQEPPADWLTGNDFQQRLEDPGLASLSGLPLRSVLDQIEQSYGLACFRDRRIDPDQIVELSEGQGNVRHLLERIAEASGASVSLPGNTVYLGPDSKARLLRTLVLQRTADVRRVLRTKTSEWEKDRTFEWPILSQPRELALSLAQSVGVTIANPELIERDLWAAGTLPEMTPVEILSVLLIGFDLTYVLSEDGKQITLVSLPDEKELAVSQSYTLKEGESISDWLRVAPAIDVNKSGRRVLVKGMVEDHETIRDLRSGKLKPESDQVTELIPLNRRRFTLKIEGVPAGDVIEELAKSGIRVVYDARVLQQQGIDLQQRVKFDVKDVPPEEFFAALFGPLGLECELSGITVRLKPK